MTIQSLKFVVAIIIFAFIKIDGQQALTSPCGRRLPSLVSRMVNAPLAEHWPWHAAIFHIYQSNLIYQCGGTVIDSKYILTAAHCVCTYNKPMRNETVSVLLGRLNLDVNETSSQSFEVDEIIIHPNFNWIDLSNDIAIIRLSNDATFNDFVQPICLWSADNTEITEIIGKNNTVIGWGRTESAELSRILRQASMPVINSFECLKSNSDFIGSMLTETNFCAGARNGTGICDGDSGGSMTFEYNGLHYIRGIVSATPTLQNATTMQVLCDPTHYAIFTDAAQYLDWIGVHVKSVNSVRCENKLVRNGDSLTCVIYLHIRHSGRDRKMIFDNATNPNATTLAIKGVLEVLPDLSDAINKFENLKTLELQGIQLKSVERSKLAVFNRIESLDLSGNQIKEFPYEQWTNPFDGVHRKKLYTNVFKELHNLTTIDLGHNHLEFLPNDLFLNNKNLEKIGLSLNFINFLQRDVFAELRNLRTIFLDRNQLERLPDGLFRNNQHLVSISLTSNNIDILHRDVFEGLHNLTVVYLGGNYLESLPNGIFRNNQNLEEISFWSCKISVLHEDVFEKLRNLIRIDLSGNDLETLPDGLFRDNQNLLKISLFSNKIGVLHQDVFKGLRNLTNIQLFHNQLETLPDGLFRDNENLEEISSNKINILHRDVFEKLHRLRKIFLDRNQLETLPDGLFRDNQNMVSIQLQRNKIKKIECNFNNLPKLSVIDLLSNVCIDKKCGSCSTTSLSEMFKKIRDEC